MEDKKNLQISKEELQAYVEKATSEMLNQLNKVRNKPNYLRSNPYENLIDHFGLESLKLIKEYQLIQAKDSKLPSGQRDVIKSIINRAVEMAIRDKMTQKNEQPLPSGVQVVSPGEYKHLHKGTPVRMIKAALPTIIEPETSYHVKNSKKFKK